MADTGWWTVDILQASATEEVVAMWWKEGEPLGEHSARERFEFEKQATTNVVRLTHHVVIELRDDPPDDLKEWHKVEEDDDEL